MTLVESTTLRERKFEVRLGVSGDPQTYIDRFYRSCGRLDGSVYLCTGAIAWVWPDGGGVLTLYLTYLPEAPEQEEYVDFDSILARAFAIEVGA